MTEPTPTLDELLERSGKITQLIAQAEGRMRTEPSTELALQIRILWQAEREARAAVRAHPDHTYAGL